MATGTRALVEGYLDAMGTGDIDALLACFSDDVVLVTPDRTFRGRTEFARECERMLAGVFTPGTYTRHVDALVIEGDLGVLAWRADCLGTEVTHGVTHFFVRDGRVALVTSMVQSRPV